MDRFEALQSFVRIVEAGSISAAAGQMQLAKSALSRRLNELEARLGTKLLTRTTRQQSLTEAGRLYYQRATQILAALEEADAELLDERQDLSGRIRMAAPLTFGLRQLSPVVLEFARQHPRVHVDLDLNDRSVDLIAEGFDLGLRIGVLENSGLRARRLAPIRNVLCASPAYWDKHGRPRHPRELRQHQALRYSNVSQQHWRYQGPDGERGEVLLPTRMQANNGDFLLQGAIDGMGVVLQPSFIAHGAIEDGRLEPMLCDFAWRELAAYAIYPPNRFLPGRVRALIDHLAAHFGDKPSWDRAIWPVASPPG